MTEYDQIVGIITDPKQKRWETGLVCEYCHRKAVALTFVKAGDLWDKYGWSRRYVGKRICQRCASQTLDTLIRGPSDREKSLGGYLFLAGTVMFFVWIGGVAFEPESAFKIPLLVLLALLSGSIVSIFLGMGFMGGRKKRRNMTKPRVLSAPLVSIEGFLESE